MDKETLNTFKHCSRKAGEATYEATQNLSPDERKTYEQLQTEETIPEQERTSPDFANERLLTIN